MIQQFFWDSKKESEGFQTYLGQNSFRRKFLGNEHHVNNELMLKVFSDPLTFEYKIIDRILDSLETEVITSENHKAFSAIQ